MKAFILTILTSVSAFSGELQTMKCSDDHEVFNMQWNDSAMILDGESGTRSTKPGFSYSFLEGAYFATSDQAFPANALTLTISDGTPGSIDKILKCTK